MSKKANGILMVLAVAMFAIPLVRANTAQAGVQFTLAYTSAPADVRVWLERSEPYDGRYRNYLNDDVESDVYGAVTDVTLCVRASRACYATVYVVDTEGYIHIVHPLSPADNGYLMGNRIYKIHLSDMGFNAAFGAGIAYAYAVCSPAPFDYAHYGIDVFGARCGYRIYGDPYVASRFFYVGLVGGRCDFGLIRVSHARFYIGSYVRYPRYLCAGWHDYHGVRTYCRGGCAVYRHYAVHARDPYSVLDPVRELRPTVSRYTRVTNVQREPDVRLREAVDRGFSADSHKWTTKDGSDVLRPLNHDKTTIRSSKQTVIQGRKDLTELRRELERRGRKDHSKEPVTRSNGKVPKAVTVGGSTNRRGSVKDNASTSSKSRGVKSSTAQKKSSKGESSKARGK